MGGADRFSNSEMRLSWFDSQMDFQLLILTAHNRVLQYKGTSNLNVEFLPGKLLISLINKY